MSLKKWEYNVITESNIEAGDSDEHVIITNNEITFKTAALELSEMELAMFCSILNKMPDLRCLELEVNQLENRILQKENSELKTFISIVVGAFVLSKIIKQKK